MSKTLEKKSKIDELFFWGLLSASFLLFVIDIILRFPLNLNNYVAIISVIISIFLCRLYRFNLGFFLAMFLIAYTNYSIAVGVYLFPEVRPEFMYKQFSAETFSKGILCILLFETMMLIFSYRLIKEPHLIDKNYKMSTDSYDENMIIAIGAIILYAAVFFFSFRMGDNGERGSSSAINEYRTIFLIIGSYYSGGKKTIKIAWTILVLITSLLVIMSGNRVDMFGSMFFLVYYWYSDFFDYKKVLIILPMVIILMAAVGFMRGGFALSSESINNTLNELSSEKLTYRGAIFGYVPSLAIVELKDTIPFNEKLSLFFDHIKYTFKIGSAGSINPDLSTYSRNYYVHYWGFISPIYFYFWTGYFGAVLFAILINIYKHISIKAILRKSNNSFGEKFGFIISAYFLSNVARWYCYGPMGLIRGAFVCFIIFCFVYVFDLVTKKKPLVIKRMIL